MKRSTITIIFCLLSAICFAQKKWPKFTTASLYIDWYNYATSYAGDDDISQPTILTAIPYNGVASYVDNLTFDSVANESINKYVSTKGNTIKNNSKVFPTYDSSEVYFIAPNIFRSNASQYNYRVLLNGTTVLKPWTSITEFADKSLQINNLKRGFAFLGGYKAIWNNFIVMEIKQIAKDSILAYSIVYWDNVKPALRNIYPAKELNEFLAFLKSPYFSATTSVVQKNWQLEYKPNEIDPLSQLPKKLILDAQDDNIIFYLQGDIYKKQALEYQLLKNGAIVVAWKANDFDNNLIWLKELMYGDYQLQMRYRSQRHNVSLYQFLIKPAWYQRFLFKAALFAFAALFFFLLFRLWLQNKKAKLEKWRKEKLDLELKAMRSQLNPHFVFNALGSIQGLINSNQIESANHYLTEFGSLLRESLKNKDEEFVPLSKELKMLETYLKLEQLRFRFQYAITVGEGLPTNEIEIPSLLIQPLVENAIKHGAGKIHEQGTVEIKFLKKESDFLIEVLDNGTGYDAMDLTTGFGLKLVNDRIELLNDSFKGQKIILSRETNRNNLTAIQILFENWFK